jgi:hypothetical protein
MALHLLSERGEELSLTAKDMSGLEVGPTIALAENWSLVPSTTSAPCNSSSKTPALLCMYLYTQICIIKDEKSILKVDSSRLPRLLAKCWVVVSLFNFVLFHTV